MEKEYIKINGISVASKLADFVKNELLENTEIDVKHFWNGFEKSINKLVPKNKYLLKKREDIQKKIDNWHNKNKINGKNQNSVSIIKALIDTLFGN